MNYDKELTDRVRAINQAMGLNPGLRGRMEEPPPPPVGGYAWVFWVIAIVFLCFLALAGIAAYFIAPAKS